MKNLKINLFMFCQSFISFAQDGIGTNTPEASSVNKIDFSTIKNIVILLIVDIYLSINNDLNIKPKKYCV
jgi:hypothetical protein